MPRKFEIYKDKTGKFRWRLKHPSGMLIEKSGKNYSTKVNAVKDLWSAVAATNNR